MKNDTPKNRSVVILAGGRGERFWPWSRTSRPKHLLPVVGDRPLVAWTLERLQGLVPMENCLIITAADHRAAVHKACPQLHPEQIIGEPMGRDTAAAVALGCLAASRHDPQGVMAILPADAAIHDDAAFRSVLESAFTAASDYPAPVTIGIRPSYPATGYGYLQQGPVAAKASGRAVYQLLRFVEKPPAEKAREYLAQGGYFWNAGIFVWSVPVLEKALKMHTPGLYTAFEAIRADWKPGIPLEPLLQKYYPKLEKISIDYAVMEKLPEVRMVEATFDWDDLGEWTSLARHFPADPQGNVLRGPAVVHKGSGNIVVSSPGHLTALLGVEDLVVVQTPDATLICPRSRVQEVRDLVRALEKDPQWKQHLV